MSESTEDYIRDLLRMSGGDALGGREVYTVPNELIDVLAGDAAQEEMMKARVLEEMRKQVTPEESGGTYVNLDMLTESMEKGDVDSFLDKARKKIIKRSKGTRKACCKKIGGVLQQMMGKAGGEYANKVNAKDRGQSDPIGEDTLDENLSPEHIKVYCFRKGESRDRRAKRIANYKKTGAIDEATYDAGAKDLSGDPGKSVEMPVRNRGGRLPKQKEPKKSLLARASDWLKKKLGSDIDHDLMNFIAEEFEISEHSDDCPLRAVLSETLSDDNYSEVTMSGNTASALAGFMESAASARPYWDKAVEAPYNSGYKTELSPVMSGRSKKAGDPGKVSGRSGKPRYEKGADPIGEDNPDEGIQISETAQALAGFMESSVGTTPYWEGVKTRKDERKSLGEAPKKAKGYGVRKGSKGIPGDPIGDAS